MSAARALGRRLLPDSITGWFVVVLVGVLVALHAGMLALFALNRSAALEAAGLSQAAARLAAAAETVEAAPQATRAAVVRGLSSRGFRLHLTAEAVAEAGAEGPVARRLAARMATLLPEGTPVVVGRLDAPHAQAFGVPGAGRRGMPHHMPGMMDHGPPPLAASIRLRDGRWLTGLVILERPEALWQPRFLAWLSALTLVVAAVAFWGVRRAVQPLRTLEAAAARLGTDPHAEPLAETGPREVRRAAAAFNDMQRRLMRYVEDRTRMLAAISHDLRTPVTRLRLRAELLDEGPDRDKMLADLEDMERMISATLAFARQDSETEPLEAVDLAGLLRAVAEDRPGVTVVAPEAVVLKARPTALRRVFGNLLDNADRYGGGSCTVQLAAEPGQAVVTVDDAGPGIPAGEREKVFAPFYRLEASRSRETGGTGLGLSVARTLVHAHGGTITLADAPGGGLRVTVKLPTADEGTTMR